MVSTRVIAAIAAGVLVTTAALSVPAFGATETVRIARRVATASPLRSGGTFTPAAADPRLAAMFARGGLDATGFRFTPAENRGDRRAVTVAVRARSTRGAVAATETRNAAPTTVGITPIAYNLGVAVGWKKFAVSGNVARVDLGPQPGGREAADVAVSYRTGRLSSKVMAAADRPLTGTPKLIEDMPSYSVDVSSSYSLSRNLDVTAGVRYRSDRERLARIDDDRRDSQAVYVGTAFRF